MKYFIPPGLTIITVILLCSYACAPAPPHTVSPSAAQTQTTDRRPSPTPRLEEWRPKFYAIKSPNSGFCYEVLVLEGDKMGTWQVPCKDVESNLNK